MAQVPPRWKRVKHHRVSERQWDSSKARRWSQNAPSVYNPHVYPTDEDVERVEWLCLTKGKQIHYDADFVSCFLHLPDTVVGFCNGAEAEFVFAELYNGEFHGYPISRGTLLERHGINP